MSNFFVLTLLGCLIAAVVGLIKPSLVSFWKARRTRGMAAAVYLSFAVLSFIAFGVTHDAAVKPQQQAAQQAEKEPKAKEPKLAAITQEEWCAFDSAKRAVDRETEARFGFSSSGSLQPGDEVKAKAETVISPYPPSKSASLDDSMQKIAALRRLPAGTQIVVRDRIWDGNSLIYKAALPGHKNVEGYINANAMNWMDDGLETVMAWSAKREDWAKPKMDALKQAHFVSRGIPFLEALTTASIKEWRCR